MWDTFRPLGLSTLWSEVDKPEYAYSWNPDRSGESPEPGRQAESDTVVTGPSA